MPLWLFGFLAALAVITSLGVVLQRHPVHCLLALALTLLDIGALFIGLGAVTVGLLQVIIYVGAIMVLFLFVIWLLNLQIEPALEGNFGRRVLGALGAAGLAGGLSALFLHAPAGAAGPAVAEDYGSIASLARLLFGDYLIAFEMTSVLLLAAVVGAIGLARRIPDATQAPVSREETSDTIRSAAR